MILYKVTEITMIDKTSNKEVPGKRGEDERMWKNIITSRNKFISYDIQYLIPTEEK